MRLQIDVTVMRLVRSLLACCEITLLTGILSTIKQCNSSFVCNALDKMHTEIFDTTLELFIYRFFLRFVFHSVITFDGMKTSSH